MLPLNRPHRTANEITTLLSFLDFQRAMVPWKIDGLDEEQARRPMVDSGTSLLGIVKHLAWVEKWWFNAYIGDADVEFPWSEEDPDADWRIEEGDSIETILGFYADAVRDANAVIAATDSLDVVGSKLEDPRSLRWVLVHMIEETARHLGHADILREQIDGTTGYVPSTD